MIKDRDLYWVCNCSHLFFYSKFNARIKFRLQIELISDILIKTSNLNRFYTLPNIPNHLWETKWYTRASISSEHKAECLLSELSLNTDHWSAHFISCFCILNLELWQSWKQKYYVFQKNYIDIYRPQCCAKHVNKFYLISFLKPKSYLS